jgi:outer membrane usher protein
VSRAAALGLALGAALATAPAAAVPADRPVPPGPPPIPEVPAPPLPPEWEPAAAGAFLDLVVNGIRGPAVPVRLAEGDVWVPEDALAAAGLSGLAGPRRTVDGRAHASLASARAAGQLAFEVDEVALALRIEAGPALLARRALDLRPISRPPGLVTASGESVHLNYAARWDEHLGATGALEAGFRAGRLAGRADAALDPDGRVVRGATELAWEDPGRLLRLSAGDLPAAGDALGGAALLVGAGAARDLALDPYLLRAPLPDTRVFVAAPSTLELRVNGVLVREQAVPPGTLDLANLPVRAGENDLSVVLRDAFGRRQELPAVHYQGSGLLARGLADWQVALGAVRRRAGEESLDLGPPALLARGRRGFTSRFTAGARLEATPERASGGASFTTAFPFGELDGALAGSRDGRASGAAALAGWRLGLDRLSAGVLARWLSPRYAHLSLAAAADRPLARADLFVAVPLGRLATLSAEAGAGRRRDAGAERSLALRATVGLGRGATLFASVATRRAGAGPAEVGGLVTLALALGGATSAELGAAVRAEGPEGGSVGLQRALPRGAGVGYRLRAGAAGDARDLSARVEAQTASGRYDAYHDRSAGAQASGAGAAGGLVGIGGRLYPSRPVEQGFALVRVPGLPGVRVALDHQVVGRTGPGGDLLVPGLEPHYGHHLAIEGADVPLDRELEGVTRLVAVPARGGAVARFEVERRRAVAGALVVAGGDAAVPVPDTGTLRVEAGGRTFASPVGGEGRFWLEGLPPGNHPARAVWGEGTCTFTLSVPEGEAVLDLGALGCTLAPPALDPSP